MNYYAKMCTILCPVSNLVTIVLLKDLFQLCHVPLLYGTGGLPHFIVYKYDFICIYRFTGTTLFNNVTFTFLYLYYFCYLILYILWTWVWNKIINQNYVISFRSMQYIFFYHIVSYKWSAQCLGCWVERLFICMYFTCISYY